MDIKEILSRVDHTLLKPESDWESVKKLTREGMDFSTASVCIPPCFVERAREYASGKVKICTAIGFPTGYQTAEAKCFEAADAVKKGADEIDMVINIGLVKEGKYDAVLEEIKRVRESCGGRLLKVIIETCLLTEDEKKQMCRTVSLSGAEYIKTSTGFSHKGATFEDVALMREYSSPELKIKAAGGISSLEDAERFIELGADRLGTSRIVALVKAGEGR